MTQQDADKKESVPTLDAYHFYDDEWESYDQLCEHFEWEIPDQFNMADYLCDRWAHKRGRVAIFAETVHGSEQVYTYRQLRNTSNQLANYLVQQGLEPGDHIGVNLSQRPEAIITHLAAWKLGAVSVPLSTKFGPEALEYRLNDCEAKACIVDTINVDSFADAYEDLDELTQVITAGEGNHRVGTPFDTAISNASRSFENRQKSPDDRALVHYTSGTTGDPKGVCHGHQVVLGHLPSFVTSFCNMELLDDHLFWTPAEWAWILLPMMILPNLFYGKPFLAYSAEEFDAEEAYRLIQKYEVTNYFAPPTALRMMAAEPETGGYDLSSIRVVTSAGEPVGQVLKNKMTEEFGTQVQEVYGQTEVDSVVGIYIEKTLSVRRHPGEMSES
jgi:acetyl-CoA synthetase